MPTNFARVEQLIAEYESGRPVDVLLAEINVDEDLLWNWGHENFEVYEFVFIVHESAVFITDDYIEDYYEPEYLLQLTDDEVAEFVAGQIESCIESGDTPTVHFCEISRSIISAIGEQRGQGGIGYVDMDITKNRSEKFHKLMKEGWMFLSNDFCSIDESLLIQKYQTFIRERLFKKI